MNDITQTDADDAGSLEPAPQFTLEQVSELIWKSTENVLELLRSHATSEVHKQKRGHIWLNDVSRAQSNAILAIKQLCDASPNGVSLKKVAETIGVTPAAASVMVDILVTKKIIKRTQSQDDRRAVLLRLTPQTSRLFEIVDRSLIQAVMSVGDELGPQMLHDWLNMLTTVLSVLDKTVGGSTGARPSLDGDHVSPPSLRLRA
jgi:DNA-binding MarR family transcriptional regulator